MKAAGLVAAQAVAAADRGGELLMVAAADRGGALSGAAADTCGAVSVAADADRADAVPLAAAAGPGGAVSLALARAAGRAAADAGPSPLARRALVNWCRRHAKGGDAAVAAGRRLVRPGQPAPLSRAQQVDLADALRDATPEDLGLAGHLWCRQSLGELIHRRYGVRLTPRGINRQLKAWGLGPRTPAERACSLCVAWVVNWLSRVYPNIVRCARSAGAQVCWAGRGRLVGLNPATEVVAAMTSRGGLRFAVTTGRADGPLPGTFLSRLAAHEGRGVHVIMDGSLAGADWPRRPPAGVVLHRMPSCARGGG